MVKEKTETLLKKAEVYIDQGDIEKARLILQPLVEEKNAEAIFLRSTFSLADEETEEEFEVRSIEMLTESARLGHPAALYALAVCYDFGDMVEQNSEQAATLFKEAAEAGYSKAKLNYGLDLIYGSNGIPKNECLGLSLIEEAANEGVEGAKEELEELRKRLNG